MSEKKQTTGEWVGKPVFHQKYGAGIVVGVERDRNGESITVCFASGNRVFPYPSAFQLGFLTIETPEAVPEPESAPDPFPMNPERRARWFLIRHGGFYAKEILSGCAFVPLNDPNGVVLMKEIRAGDRFFLASEQGIGAVGLSTGPCRIDPFPAWRYERDNHCDRGCLLDLRVFLLREPVPVEPGGYLTPLTDGEANRYLESVRCQSASAAAFLCQKPTRDDT